MPRETAPSEDVVVELRHRYDELTQSQKRIAEAIVEDPEFIAFATVDQVATKLGVSPATVVRFAYRMGLDGYPDLQGRVRQLVRAQIRRAVAAPDGHDAVTVHLDDSVFARSLALDIEDLRRTVQGLDLKQLERAVSVLDAAERLFVFGGLGSYAAAYFAGVTLDRLRGRSVALDANDALNAARLADATASDALVVFTFAPYVRSGLRLAQFAKSRKMPVLAVTDTPVSPVGRVADVALPAVVSGLSTHNSLVAVMAVTNALLNGLVVARSGRALERYQGVTKLLNDWDQMILKGDGET